MNKIKEILNTRNKKIIAIVSAVVVIGITSVSIYALTNNNAKREILKVVESVTLEYGEDASKDAKLYMDTTELTEDEKTEILKHATVEFTNLKIQENETYPNIGEYTVTVTYQEEQQETKLIVEDTIAPVFNDVDEITFEQGTEDFPYHEHIEATDLQDITYDFQIDTVDIHAVGEYTILVIATDASENVAEKEIKVVVTEKIEEEPQEEETTGTNDSNVNNSHHNNAPNSNTGGNNNNGGNANNNTNSNNSNSNANSNTGGNANSNNQGSNNGANTTPPPSNPTPPPVQNPYVNANLVISAPNANGRSNDFWFANGVENDNWVWNYLSSVENRHGHNYSGFSVRGNGFGGFIYQLYV